MNDINKFHLLISSDLEYEGMVIYLEFGNGHVATLNCDEGVEKTIIEIFARFEDKVEWKFEYQAFLEKMNMAYSKLKEVNGITNE